MFGPPPSKFELFILTQVLAVVGWAYISLILWLLSFLKLSINVGIK